MLYIHETRNTNGTHASQMTPAIIGNADWLPVPQELEAKTLALLPFVIITVVDGTITAVEDNVDARAAYVPPVDPTPPPSNEELASENTLLKAQVQALTNRNDFVEDCIAEMAMQVYQ